MQPRLHGHGYTSLPRHLTPLPEAVMPQFYFDIDAGPASTRDMDGLDLACVNAASDAAVDALPHIASDVFRSGTREDVSVKVRDASGRYRFQATLSISATPLDV